MIRFRIAIGYEKSAPGDAAVEEFTEFLWGPNVEVDVVSIASYLFWVSSPSLNTTRCRSNT